MYNISKSKIHQHSALKIQPTTSPTFVFSVFASVGKSGIMKENCSTVVLVVVHRVFLFSLYYFTQKV
jgi:hypothetical protein